MVKGWLLKISAACAIGGSALGVAFASVNRGLAEPALAFPVASALQGFVLGLAQCSILQRFGICKGCWVLMTMTGSLIFSLIGLEEYAQFPNNLLGTAIFGMTAGLGLGTLQAFTGWGYFAPYLWIARNTLGWAIGVPIQFVALGFTQEGNILITALTLGLAGALTGLILACLTLPMLPKPSSHHKKD